MVLDGCTCFNKFAANAADLFKWVCPFCIIGHKPFRYQCHIQQFFGGASFLTSIMRRKTAVQLWSLGLCCKPVESKGQNPGNFWLFCVLNSSKHHSLGSATRNTDKSLHQKSTLLSTWGFEFGIPNRYTGFKIALDMALAALTVVNDRQNVYGYLHRWNLQESAQNKSSYKVIYIRG